MKISQFKNIKSESEARQFAIDWQGWASQRSLSYQELNEWQNEFWVLAQRFNLVEEFQENGII